ncbi:hypothetical protein ACFL6U_02300 [Planctomycetota bacterium]
MKKRRNKAMVLVTVLWVAVILTILVASTGRTHRVDTKISVYTAQQRRCAWAARAGIETALAVLGQDDPSSDSLDELWSDNDEDYNDVSVGGCTLTIRVIDEASKLNINTATKDQLMGLPEMTSDIADAILDWRDRNDQPREEGVEAGYYEQLSIPYTIRNGPFRTVRELLLVKGVEEEEDLFYGEDTNFNNQLDENERDGDESLPLDNGDSELDRGWIAYLTCYSYEHNRDGSGQERVNINEASQEDLESELGLQPGHAKWIVDNRDDEYDSIGDLINNRSPKRASQQSGDSDEAQALDLETYKSIVDKITVSEDDRLLGRVNLNTASHEVLAALFGGEDEGRETAESVKTYREGLMFGMSSVGSLLNVSGVNVSTFKDVVDHVTVRSPVYAIRCVAQANQTAVSGATGHYQAVVDRSETPPMFLYRYQGAGTQ